MNHLDLFAGIGGFSLSARMAGGIETVAFCEIDPYCRQVLAKNFPGVPIHDDIKTLKGDEYGAIDLITAGYPCQPVSCAGKRAGKEDDRWLWPEVSRVIEAARPRFLLCENVAGHITLGLDDVLSDLEAIGYTCWPLVIPAVACDAKHIRARLWIVANDDIWWRSERRESCSLEGEETEQRRMDGKDIVAHAGKQGLSEPARRGLGGIQQEAGTFTGSQSGRGDAEKEQRARWLFEPDVGRVAHGIPRRVDRLKSLGNSIVPQVAAEILKAILQADEK